MAGKVGASDEDGEAGASDEDGEVGASDEDGEVGIFTGALCFRSLVEREDPN